MLIYILYYKVTYKWRMWYNSLKVGTSSWPKEKVDGKLWSLNQLNSDMIRSYLSNHSLENWKVYWKYCSKITFLYINSNMRLIFNEKVTEKVKFMIHTKCTPRIIYKKSQVFRLKKQKATETQNVLLGYVKCAFQTHTQ